MPWRPIPIRLSCGTRAGSGRPTAAMAQTGSPTVPAAAMRRAASVAAGEVCQVVVAVAGAPVGFGAAEGPRSVAGAGLAVGFAVTPVDVGSGAAFPVGRSGAEGADG